MVEQAKSGWELNPNFSKKNRIFRDHILYSQITYKFQVQHPNTNERFISPIIKRAAALTAESPEGITCAATADQLGARKLEMKSPNASKWRTWPIYLHHNWRWILTIYYSRWGRHIRRNLKFVLKKVIKESEKRKWETKVRKESEKRKWEEKVRKSEKR